MTSGAAIPGVIEAMETCPAIRRFASEPVPDELVERVVYAATCAPSASNSQPWAFVAVRDPEVKREFAALTTPTSIGNVQRLLATDPPERERRMYLRSLELAQTLGDVPVLIFVCATGVDRAMAVNPRVWMGVYPAAQNLLLAARSLGLGTTLATYHFHDEEGVSRLLGLPDDVIVAATVAMGWPATPFTRVRRRPVAEVLHWERWG